MNSSFVRNLDIICDELSLRSIIDKTCDECPEIGVKTSLISETNSSFRVTFSSSSESITNRSEAVFRFLLPANTVFNQFAPNSRQSIEKLLNYSSNNDFAKKSIELITKCLSNYKPEELCVGFNGGKDCTALLHIVYCLFANKYPNNKLNVFYISIPDSFPSLETFVQQTVQRYDLNLISYCSPNYKIALENLKNNTKIKAIFMGTRTTDLPNHVLKDCQMTDSDWPQFMRVSPLLNWSYSQIWSFVRDMDVLYCSLYDRGYTSIGSKSNTSPNPLLKYVSKKGDIYYLPAYMLTNEEQERSGRT